MFAKGVAASLIGILFLIAPPNQRLPRAVLATLLAVMIVPLLGLLPQSWFGATPAWRTHLIDDWGITLAGTSSAQPFVTLEAWILLSIGIAWLAWCASRGTTLEDRRTLVRCLVGGLGTIAILTLLNRSGAVHVSWWKFPFEIGPTFGGPFANRNHTSSLMVMGSIMCAAFAYDAYRNKQRRWALSLPLLAIFFIVIITNTSRAGVLLFFVGITMWLWTAGMRKGMFKKIALASAIVFAGIALVVIFGGPVTGRLADTISSDSSANLAGGRTAVYSDAVKMTSTAPWAGIGLGNFSAIFPLQASFHEPAHRFLHPESDGLWVMVEGGMSLLIAFIAMIATLFNMTGPWNDSRDEDSSSRQDRRLRHAAAIAACIAVFHGIVDVPNHTLGFGLFSALLLAMAVRPSKVRTEATSVDRAVFRLAGLGALAAGIAWLMIAMGRPVMPGSSSARLLFQQALEHSTRDQDGTALKLMDRAIEMNPLNWTFYFQRARIRLKLKHSPQLAMMDFGRARAIEPHYAFMCYDEGIIWLGYQPRFAIQAWKEFLNRHPTRTDYYSHFLQLINNDPDLFAEARKLANTATLKLSYLSWINDSAKFRDMLSELLRQTPTLEGLQPQQRVMLFRMWMQLGDRETLKSNLLKNALWQQDGWPILAEMLAKEGDYQGAYQLSIRHEPPPISPSSPGLNDLSQLEQNFLFNPLDPRRGIDLYFAQKAKMQWSSALATLEKVAGLPEAPTYVTYEMASVYAQKQDFHRAWELMTKYLSIRKLPESEAAPAPAKKKTLVVPPPPPVKSYLGD